jgi:UDP-N-acetylmuramoyl-tripeptide--D-alanyl-D-alanine ligase
MPRPPLGERLADLAGALRTASGCRRLLLTVAYHGWPVLGATAALYRRTGLRRTRVVCVTGSFGKTTAMRAITVALGNALPGPWGNAQGQVAIALLRVRPRQRHAVFEVGIARPGQMRWYPPMLRPDVAVVTGIGSEHGRSFGSLEATRHEKAEILRALDGRGVAVLNGDDLNVRWMIGETRARVLTYGFGSDVDVRATDMTLDWPHGTRFRLHSPAGIHEVRVRLFGRLGVYAVLAAAAVALAEGYPLDRALSALATLPPTPGRLQPVALPGGAHLLRDDFKSPAETIETALDVLAEIPAARRLVVLGAVSEPRGSQRALYREIGMRLGRIATRAVLVGFDDVRSYRPGTRAAGMPADAVIDVGPSVHRAAAAIAADLRPGDVVLVKGRDTQRLERVGLLLAGHSVRCERVECHIRLVRCEQCPLLDRAPRGPAVTR